MIEDLLILFILFILIIIINNIASFDKISKGLIYSFQFGWGIILIFTCFQPYGLYLPSAYTYLLLSLNVLSFTVGFSAIKINYVTNNILNSKQLLESSKRIINNKWFISYLIIITIYIFSLLKKYFAKLAVVNNLGELRVDFYYDNFYGDWFNYINLLFLYPTQILLLGLTMYCIFKYRKPIIILMIVYLLAYSTLGGGRFDYMTIFLSFIFFSICLSKLKFKRLIIIISLCLIIFGAFSLITNMRGNGAGQSFPDQIKNGTEQTLEHIIIYPCGAIVAFDHAVNDNYMQKIGGPKFGGLTFSGILSLVNMITKRLGFPIKEPLYDLMPYKQEKYILVGNQQTHNALYTAMIYPYLDFGIFGIIFIPFLLGLFVRWIIKQLYKYRSLPLVILANQCYIMCLFSTMEFRGIAMFSTTTTIIILYLWGTNRPYKSKSKINI